MEIELAEAVRLWHSGEVDVAQTELEAMTVRWPDQAESFLYLGMILLERQDDAHAERALAQAARLAPDEGVVHFRHAEALAQLGRFEEAVSALLLAIESSPLEPKPYLALARMLESSGQHERAISLLEDALGSAPIERLQEEIDRIRGVES